MRFNPRHAWRDLTLRAKGLVVVTIPVLPLLATVRLYLDSERQYLHLPDMPGEEVLRRIREGPETWAMCWNWSIACSHLLLGRMLVGKTPMTDHNEPSDTVTFGRDTIHTVNNHLAVILGFVDLMIEDAREDDPRRQDLLEIRQAAAAAVTLLDPALGRTITQR